MSLRVWSPKQLAIFEFIKTGTGSATVKAVAGGAKTSTIVQGATFLDPKLQSVFVAFNRNVKEKLAAELPPYCRAMTLNGMGMQAWTRHIPNGRGLKVDASKTRTLMRTLLSEADGKAYGSGVAKLVALAKSEGLVPTGALAGATGLVRDTDDFWLAMIDKHGLEFEEGADERRGIHLARMVLVESIKVREQLIDFDDQLYMPVIMGARFYQNDFLFVDEAQDVNAIQRAMLKRALKPAGRLIAVGDPHQAIYGFRGAETDGMAKIEQEFNCRELWLDVSYRCPKAVVAEAQQYVSHIQPSPAAKDGSVLRHGTWNHTLFSPADAVLCRQTAPLVDLAFKLIRNKVGCRVLGREIGQGLISMVEKMRARDIDALELKLAAFLERETAKFMAKGQEEKADALSDRVATLHVFIEALPETNRTVRGLTEAITNLFSDNGSGVLTLCTGHKAKGLEWERVFLLDWHLCPSKYARQDWQMAQEVNLQYVMVTRAKSELHYVDSDKMSVSAAKAA